MWMHHGLLRACLAVTMLALSVVDSSFLPDVSRQVQANSVHRRMELSPSSTTLPSSHPWFSTLESSLASFFDNWLSTSHPKRRLRTITHHIALKNPCEAFGNNPDNANACASTAGCAFFSQLSKTRSVIGCQLMDTCWMFSSRPDCNTNGWCNWDTSTKCVTKSSLGLG